MSDVSHTTYDSNGSRFVSVRATGGNRRERGSATGAFIRSQPGKWVRFHTSYSETHGFLSATFTKYRQDEVPDAIGYDVHTGSPSWHQARVGAISSGIVSFGTRDEALEYVESFKARHPHDTVFIKIKF